MISTSIHYRRPREWDAIKVLELTERQGHQLPDSINDIDAFPSVEQNTDRMPGTCLRLDDDLTATATGTNGLVL